MAFEFKLPDVGEGIHEGEIVRWRVKLGETIKEDQPIIEVETAKAIVELPSPKAGVILKMNGAEGETIHVGDVLVVIGAEGEKIEEAKTVEDQARAQGCRSGGTPILKQGGASANQNSSGDMPIADTDTPNKSSKDQGVVGQIPAEIGGFILPSRTAEAIHSIGRAPKIMPRIRMLAGNLGVDIGSIQGTGNGGEITENDVRALATKVGSAQKLQSTKNNVFSATTNPTKQLPKQNFEKFGTVERTQLKGMRKAIAEHMVLSMSMIPSVTHCDEFDASNLVKKRTSQKPDAEKAGVKLTYLAYIVQAVVAALKEFPEFNASIDDSTNEVVYKNYMNIGIAVDTHEGLMVPVIKSASQKDLFAIAGEIVELAEKARTRKVTPTDIEGGTFTITNIGSIGGTEATPIIAYGQSAILGVMKLADKPVAIAGKVEVRPVMSLCLSYDHRLLDGAQAARFMNAVIAELQI